jgi:hypothetical protein
MSVCHPSSSSLPPKLEIATDSCTESEAESLHSIHVDSDYDQSCDTADRSFASIQSNMTLSSDREKKYIVFSSS